MALNFADIQGLVVNAYRRYWSARYVLLRFGGTPATCQKWLAELLSSGDIDSAAPKDTAPGTHPGVRINVAFAHSGLEKLGLYQDTLAQFPAAFAEGLGRPWKGGVPDHRSRILGDLDDSKPAGWEWGYQDGGTHVDAILLVFGMDDRSADAAADKWTARGEELGALSMSSPEKLRGHFPDVPTDKVKEAFGFVDGVSQPVLKSIRRQLRLGDRRTQPPIHEIEDGEMLLGHRDGAGQLPPSPTVDADRDPHGLLPPASSDGFTTHSVGARDFGFNGTYLVFRQLEQNVAAFEGHCTVESKRLGMPLDRYKALLVGRWQDGSPLVSCPLGPNPSANAPPAANDFGYADDPVGRKCPIGAHIRRTNPRDSLVDDPAESWRISNRHRILRRGRPYESENRRGLHFICLNADIVRHFEFIQHNWINDPAFGGLTREVDPLLGRSPGAARADTAGRMTLPPPLEGTMPRQITTLQRYVTVKGGGYFFLPSLTALWYLAGTAPPRARAHATEWEPPPRPLTKADAVRLLAHGRFSFLLAAVLALAPTSLFSEQAGLRSLLEPMFRVERWWELTFLAMATSLTAAVAMVTWRTVQLHAPARFGLQTGWSKALTWGRVGRWQALTLPWMGSTMYLSCRDSQVPARVLGVWFLAVLGGYAAAFLLMAFAEWLRGWSVRDTNSEDTVILPPSLRRRLRRQMPSVIAQAKPSGAVAKTLSATAGVVVDFVESHTATVSTDRARGYIDHRTGHILPGHLSGAMLAAAAALLLALVRVAFQPSCLWFGAQLPSSFYLLLVLSIVTFAAAGAAFWLDRYRVPLLALLVTWLALSGTFRDGDHRFPISVGTDGEDIEWHVGLSATDALQKADQTLGKGTPNGPVVVIAAGGGGAYQAAWVARVLSGLTELWGERFSGAVRLVSATSGGAVGAMHFLHRYRADGPPAGNLSDIVGAAASGSTGDVWWGLTYFDLARVLPLRIERDRGWALERAWERVLKPDEAQRTMGQWRQGTDAGWRPALAFNSMAVETGERVVLATYALPSTSPAKSLGDVTGNRDIDVVTAARLSASFPYVTPFARAAGDSIELHLADGGYWDNHGVATALEWLDETSAQLDGRPVILIRIPPPTTIPDRPRNRTWVWQLTAPISGLDSMRTNSQKVRNDHEMARYTEPTFPPVDFLAKGTPSLSWHVSLAERCQIERTWRRAYETELKQVEKILGPRKAGQMPGPPAECMP